MKRASSAINRTVVVVATLIASTGIALSLGSTVASAAKISECTRGQLNVRLGQSQGTAGTVYVPVVFTNKGPACTIWGVPAVQPISGPAHRSVGPQARNNSMGMMPVMHTLAKGHSVSAAIGFVDTGNFSASMCAPRKITGIMVTLGSFVPHAYLKISTSVCTKTASVTTRLLAPGING